MFDDYDDVAQYESDVFTFDGTKRIRVSAPNEYVAFDVMRRYFGEPVSIPQLVESDYE